MKTKEIIINEYPLTNKIDSELDCYYLDSKRYLVFWNEKINKDSINSILDYIQKKANESEFSEWKTIIVVGETEDVFKKKELLYFDNISTFVNFYLINDKKKEIYMNDSWIFTLGCNYKKYVRKINSIVVNHNWIEQ